MNQTITDKITARFGQHSPGPWRYEAGTQTIRSVPANYWIATVDSADGMVNNEANARLIAAAPDLLEALEWLLPGAEAMGWDITKAKAAITKAKGEQP